MADGVDSSLLYGIDIEARLLDYGFYMFQDRERIKSHFKVLDLFKSNAQLETMKGKFDIIYVFSIFTSVFLWKTDTGLQTIS